MTDPFSAPHAFISNDGIRFTDYLGLELNDSLRKSMDAALRRGNASSGPLADLAQKAPCCDCSDLIVAVITCAYKLEGNSNAVRKIENAYNETAEGVNIAKALSDLGWKAIYYDNDFSYVRSSVDSWARSMEQVAAAMRGSNPRFFAEISSKDQRDPTGNTRVAGTQRIVEISVSGAYTDFAQFPAGAYNGRPTSDRARHKAAATHDVAAARSAVERLDFAYGVALGGWHNFLLEKNTVHEGLPSFCRGESREGQGPKSTKGFDTWVKKAEAGNQNADLQGILLIPPGINMPGALKSNLTALRDRKIYNNLTP